MGSSPVSRRRDLLRWLGWFAVANAVVLAFVGLLYFHRFSMPGSPLATIYLVLAYLGHHLMLATVPIFLIAGLLALLRPSRSLVVTCAVIVMALVIAIYVLDGLLWSQSRFHINALTAQILGWKSWVFAGVIAVIAMVFESMLAGGVRSWVDGRKRRGGVWVGSLGFAALVGAWFIYAWADANYFVPVTSMAERLPVYKGFTAKRQLTRLGLVDLERARERDLTRRASGDLADESSRLLDYPANALQCQQPKPGNLLIIMLDAWRFDMLSERVSPRIFEFARQRGQRFHNHFSGGNGSRSGFFSFFYGLPPGYWSSIKAVQQPAPLVKKLLEDGYESAIFSSGSLAAPVELDRSAFSGIPEFHISKPIEAPNWMRDKSMTAGWLAWLDGRDQSRPFFSFMLYDSTTGSRPPDDYPFHFEAAGEGELSERFAGYQAAAHYADSLVGEVFDGLERRGLMDETVIIITADHGEEFDDSAQGFERHGSGFTRYQLQVPLVIAWPGRKAQEHHHRTSHYDVTPTLFEDFVGCTNPAGDFSIGRNLFDQQDWQWLIVGSYFNYAVVEPDQLTITFPSGAYEVRDWDYMLMPDASPSAEVLSEVISANMRYYAQ